MSWGTSVDASKGHFASGAKQGFKQAVKQIFNNLVNIYLTAH